MKKKPVAPTKQKIYVIHGWAYSLQPWEPLVKMMRAEGVELELLKVPGLSKPSQRTWTINAYVKWLDGQLSSAASPIVMGHSNGGRILLNYCHAYPGKLRQAILLNSAGVLPSRAQRLRNWLLLILSKTFGFLKGNKFLRSLIHRVLGAGDYRRAPDNMKLTMNEMFKSDKHLVAKLAEIKTPVSFIWGEADKATPLAAGRFLQSALSEVRHFKVLKGAGHAPYITHPAELTRALLKVLMNP